ncbi:hypothetical protein CU633_02520 [Bacillus sp. V3-13]|uniref:hypothetical protein n=1 Tax=Bacillus sp. V3-13 TaxID=2053728 RepID=UPI000C7809E7|nr:hypothetical protein [Bacillus sp. V3-13]PLR79076.1 hypothetical protein CU633_02520 [Bacillus sp. V3-13]
MKKFIKYAILIALLFILTSCLPTNKVNSSSDVSTNKETIIDYSKMEETEAKNSEGGFAFNYNLENYFTTKQTHYLDEQEVYKANIEVGNYFSTRTKFRIFIFVDNKLTQIVANNKNQNFLDYDLHESDTLKTLRYHT